MAFSGLVCSIGTWISRFTPRAAFAATAIAVFAAVTLPFSAAAQRKTCVDCHETFKDLSKLDVVHEPFKNCETCHKRHGFAQQLVLVKGMPDLCTECHEDVAAQLAGDKVHAALSKGGCTVCHNPHASNVDALLREQEDNLPVCVRCHTGIAEKLTHADVHEPAGKFDCGVCHAPHASDLPSLLVADEAAVCETCHENVLDKHEVVGAGDFACSECHDPHVASKKTPMAGYAHSPFASGDCEDCHALENNEVSIGDDFPPDDLCATCHDDKSALIAGETSHFGPDPLAAEGTSTCLRCHEHHSSRFDGLLTAFESEVCTKCHEGLPDPRTGRGVFHAPYAKGTCSSCHDPHGGGDGKHLVKESSALCLECHQGIQDKMQAGPNSHEALQLTDCTDCHDAHVADNLALLKGRADHLCFTCHDKEQPLASHEPYTTGACGACHMNHQTTAGLLKADEKTICRDCHAQQFALLDAPFVHAAAQDEACTLCHNPHGSEHDGILTGRQTDLCFDCHDLGDLTLTAPAGGEDAVTQLHDPVESGDCGGCHDPHGSTLEGLLARDGAELCYGCHTQERIQFAEGAVHQPVAEGKCSTCHTPHGGALDHLRAKGEPELCTGCHDFSQPPLSASHEGFDVAGSKCTTCHNPHNSTGEHLLNVVSHEPFADNDCESCHEGGASAVVAFEADMCLMCHDDKESGTGHQHVGGGVDCIECHSPHTSRFDGLLHNPSRLCQRCHSDVLEADAAPGSEITLHKPLENGLCLDCHKMHDSPAEGYLVSGQETLCANCHESIRARASHANQHDPFQKGKCSSCHATHAAGELHMLKKDEQRLCKTCHRISTEEMSQAHGNMTLSGENCTTCHDPHSTQKAGTALVYANRHAPYEDGDCAACHADDGSVGGSVEVCMDCHNGEDFPAVHAAGRTGEDTKLIGVCLDCHSPHAGHDNMFRRKSDLETCVQCHDRKDFSRANVHAAMDDGCATCHDVHNNNFSELKQTPVNDLCVGCHEESMSHAHPIGSEHEDPRSGAPMTCVSCHEPHSSDFDYMLTFDHRRDLCIQCHAAGTMRAH